MTLCAVWKDILPSGAERLVIASDSRITGGYRYDFGTKLMIFARNDCSLCWEGAISYTYSFAVHAKSDIDWSDILSDRGTDVDAVCNRIVLVFNDMWAAARKDKQSQFLKEHFSFLFGGYSSRRSRCVAWHIERGDNDVFVARELSLEVATYIGSGKDAALERAKQDPEARPYSVLCQVIDDPSIGDVGGVPQAFVMSKEVSFPVGTLKGGRRYVFGRNVQSSGHRLKVCYVRYGEEIPLQPETRLP